MSCATDRAKGLTKIGALMALLKRPAASINAAIRHMFNALLTEALRLDLSIIAIEAT
jgi:hypothetical protein